MLTRLLALLLLLSLSLTTRAQAQATYQWALPVDFNTLLGNVGTIRSPEPVADITTVRNMWGTQALPYINGAGVQPGNGLPDPTDGAYTWLGVNFDDRVMTGYQYAQHANDAAMLTYTRSLAQQIVTHPWLSTNIVAFANQGNDTLTKPSPRDFSPYGIALAAVDQRDPQLAATAKATLSYLAWWGAVLFAPGSFHDGREDGYALMTLVLAVAVGADSSWITNPVWAGMDYRTEALRLLNTYLGKQNANGWWLSEDGTPGLQETSVFFNGIMVRALLLYDRVIGDPRILPAVLKTMTWWETVYQTNPPNNADNVTHAGGWWYSTSQLDPTGLTGYNTAVYPSATGGMILPALVEAYKRTADPRWKTLVTNALHSIAVNETAGGGGALTGSKEINQAGYGIWLASGVLQSTAAAAGPAYDSSCTATASYPAASISCTITVGAIANGILLINLGLEPSGSLVTSATVSVGGVTTGVIPLASRTQAALQAFRYYKLAPTPGPITVTVTPNLLAGGMTLAVASYANVLQATPLTDQATAGADTGTALSTASITGTAGDLIVGSAVWRSYYGQSTLVGIGSGQTQRVTRLGDAGIVISDKAVTGATTLTETVSLPNFAWIDTAVILKALSGTQIDVIPPSAPTNLSIAAASTASITGTWTPSTDNVAVTSYHVERSPGGCLSFVEVLVTPVASFTDVGLTAGTQYCYRVRADDGTNRSAYSAGAVATTFATQNVDIVWVDQQPDGISSETGFRVRAKAGPTGTWTTLTTTGPSPGTGGTMTYNYAAAPSPTVCAQVIATNAVGDSAPLGGDAGVCFTAVAGTVLAVSPPSMTFAAILGGTTPPPQSLLVQNVGGPGMAWTLADNVIWLGGAPTSATDTTLTTVSISLAGLTAGVYQGTITVTAPGATGSPAFIPVTLNLAPAGTPASRGTSGRVR